MNILQNHFSNCLSLQDFHHIKGYFWQVVMCMLKREMHMAAHTTKGQTGSSHSNSAQQNYVINSTPEALFHTNDWAISSLHCSKSITRNSIFSSLLHMPVNL